MAVPPLNVARISLNLRAFNLMNTLQRTQVGLFRTQNQLATGLRFAAPSEDPSRAAAATRLGHALDTLGVVSANVQKANAVLTEGENAMQEAVDLLREAQTLASGAVNDVNAADERASLAVVARSLLDRVVSVANRRHLDTYLFSGRYGEDTPFEDTGEGVLYRGDDGKMQTTVESDFGWDSFTIPGSEFFNAVSNEVRGWTDLNPALTAATRISDLRGATGSGVALGRIAVMQGGSEVQIDLSGAATVGDVIDLLNANLPTPLAASLSAHGIDITSSSGPGDILISDIAGGRASVDLGIATTTRAAAVLGQDLDPRLTPLTPLNQLASGAGVSLSGGITIRNGSRVAGVSFDGAATIEDVLNRINAVDIGVWARIADDGSTLEVRNRLSGTDLYIEENGGSAAASLGIRSLHSGTPLSQLNDGRGIETVAGDDLRITTADGTVIDVDLDTLNLSTATMKDVMDLLNAEGAGAINVTFGTAATGLIVTDSTSGLGQIRIERLNVSPAIDGLGLDVSATFNQLIGRDVNPARVNSPFTALIELRNGLEANDTTTILKAGARIENTLTTMQRVQGKLAANAKSMLDRAGRIDNQTTMVEVQQSEVRDADMTESIVKFQQLQTALQANMQTASKVLSLSLLDYLR